MGGADAVQFHAGVAGGDGDFADAVAAQQRVRDGVFACARADDQDFLTHDVSFLQAPLAGLSVADGLGGLPATPGFACDRTPHQWGVREWMLTSA